MNKRTKTEFIIVHCAATSPSMDIGAKEIERWHRQRGFLTIGYHYVIRRDGTIEKGRPEDTVGAHVSGMNSVSIGICLVGGVQERDKKTPENNFTEVQFETLKRLIADVQTRYPNTKVRGHNDFAAKACPCFNVKAMFPDK